MENNSSYKESLNLLEQFLSETPQAQIDDLIKKYDDLSIEGPTFIEYLQSFESQFDINNWKLSHEMSAIDFNEVGIECDSIIEGMDNRYYIPPPKEKYLTELSKKDSVTTTGSFFCILLHHD